MQRTPTICLLIVSVVLWHAISPAPGAALTAIAEPTSSVPPTLDEATQRALELEQMIEEYRAESIAIEERLSVTNSRIVIQQDALAEARRALSETSRAYRERMVGIYKSGVHDPVSILLTAETMSDFYSRIYMLTRIADRDRRALDAASIAAAEAHFHANYLDDLKAQDLALRRVRKQGADDLDAALREQQQLVDHLTAESKRLLAVRRAANVGTRAQWLRSSVPLDDTVRKVAGVVEPYTDRTYLVSEYHPKRYRSLGQTGTAFCSWYGNEFHGRMTACGQIYNQNDFTCASRTLPFGTRLALTRGENRIVVVVTDRGPFIAGRDLDLSRGAAQALGFSGLATVHVEYVEAIAE